jgi:hypothetical protein
LAETCREEGTTLGTAPRELISEILEDFGEELEDDFELGFDDNLEASPDGDLDGDPDLGRFH